MKSGRRIAHYGQPQDNRQTTRDRTDAPHPQPVVLAAIGMDAGKCAATGTMTKAASRRPSCAYFSLISRRRSSRKPCAVIGSG